MMKKLCVVRRWVFAKPSRIAMICFLWFVPGFWLYRLLFSTERFLSAPSRDILYSTIVGLCFAILVYIVGKKQRSPEGDDKR